MDYINGLLTNAYEIHGDRHYVQNLPELIGLELTYYKTGNISSARLNREHCSNTRAYREIGECGRVWLDDNDVIHVDAPGRNSPVVVAAVKEWPCGW
jgi:hypothetical protein